MDTHLYDNLTDIPLPARKTDGHKGTFGKVLIIAGFDDYTGACVLCAESALRSGAGMVKVFTSDITAGVLRIRTPELIVASYHDKIDTEKLTDACKWADVIAIGPGLGTSQNAELALFTALKCNDKKFVIDADAINILAKKIDGSTKERLRDLCGLLPGHSVLTPHVAELSRLTGLPAKEIVENPADVADIISENFNGTIVMKNAVTLTVSLRNRAENHHGNDGMATAGSGDVLTGLIAGIRAQGAGDFEAAACGVRIHAEAGDRAAARKSRHSMTAGDMIYEFDGIFKDLENIK